MQVKNLTPDDGFVIDRNLFDYEGSRSDLMSKLDTDDIGSNLMVNTYQPVGTPSENKDFMSETGDNLSSSSLYES